MTTTACPDGETLAAFVDGRLGAADLQQISSHLIECERCYGTVAATVRFLSGGGRVENTAPSWALLPAITTAVVMALALTVCLLLLGHAP